MALLDTELESRGEYARAFSCLFWAFLFFVDMRIGTSRLAVDLLPDCVGYALMAWAAIRLLQLHTGAAGLRGLAVILAVLSVPDVFQKPMFISRAAGIDHWVTPFWPWAVAVAIPDVIAIWKLCGVIADLATHVNAPATARHALLRRQLYAALLLSFCIVLGLSSVFRPLVFLALVLALAAMVVFFLMMGLMKQAERLCKPPSELHSASPELGANGGSRDASDNCSLVRSDRPADASDGQDGPLARP